MKSPPELWAEVSDAASLARHLGEVGEITITRLEPETTVAWEGERASGTVELAPAGWGTSVTFTAEPTAAEAAVEPAVVLEPTSEPEAAHVATAEAEPEAAAERAPAPAAVAEPEPAAPELVTITEPEPAPEPAAEAAEPRRSWFARLFNRTAKPATPAPVPATIDADRAGGDEDAPPAAEARTAARVGGPDSTGPAPSSVEPEPEPQAPDPQDPLEAVLTSALDSLGQAHHRPFSRG
ncbi:MAG TPA: hypothetical protein VFG31_06905 [Conexibacter sp.]|nr:hypothetical protein [Conexibacter sp.]